MQTKITELRKKIPASKSSKIPRISQVAKIDLDSNGKPDFIVEIPARDFNEKTEEAPLLFTTECFVSDKGELKACGSLPTVFPIGFNYRYFAQLDEDSMLELFAFDGDEESSDYYVFKFDPKTWKARKLFELSSAVFKPGSDKKQVSSSYPWWIDDLELTPEKKLYARVDPCSIEEPDGVTATIVFLGRAEKDLYNSPTWEARANYLGKKETYTLSELEQAVTDVKKNRKCSHEIQ